VIEIILEPVHTRPGIYAATRDGQLLCKSRQPFFDAARALLALGADPETPLQARHAGSATVAMQSSVGEAAKWTIEGGDARLLTRRLYKPHPRTALAHESASEAEGRAETPGGDPNHIPSGPAG
jgi:hypothetical protein